MSSGRIPCTFRLPAREHALLTLAAKQYRAPSTNWFLGEMVGCMLNPARWPEFSARLTGGTIQMTLLQETPVRKDPVAGTRKRGERRGVPRRKGARPHARP